MPRRFKYKNQTDGLSPDGVILKSEIRAEGNSTAWNIVVEQLA